MYFRYYIAFYCIINKDKFLISISKILTHLQVELAPENVGPVNRKELVRNGVTPNRRYPKTR